MAWTLSSLGTYTAPSPDVYGTAVACAELDNTASGPETVHGSGSDLNVPPVEGRLTARDAAGNILWTYQSEGEDYIMSAEIGDVDGDGENEIAVGLRYVDNKAVLLDKDGVKIWEHSVLDTGADHLRVSRIGKLTAATGNQVFFAGAAGRALLLDKDGNEIWDINLSSSGGNASVQWGLIADLDENAANEIYVAHNSYIRRLNPANGAVVWSAAVTATGGSLGACMGIATGKFFDEVSGKQIVGCVASRGDAKRPSLVWVDKDGNILQTRYLHYDVYCAVVGSFGGYDRIFVGGGSHDTASPPALGAGYVMMLSRRGEPMALLNMPSSVKFLAIGDANNDGHLEVLASCDDGKLYIIRVSQT